MLGMSMETLSTLFHLINFTISGGMILELQSLYVRIHVFVLELRCMGVNCLIMSKHPLIQDRYCSE